jgi:glutathione S-transferase
LNGATLSISSKNYSSWALRGWLMTKFSGLPFSEKVISPDDPAMRAELLLLSSSFLVPCLIHNGLKVWDTLAIRRISKRDQARGGAFAAGRPREADPLPLDQWGDALGLWSHALGPADDQ